LVGSGWDEMLEEFRALRGTADNVRLGQGSHGRGREGGYSGFGETHDVILNLLAAVEGFCADGADTAPSGAASAPDLVVLVRRPFSLKENV
jgi:hypothetical protein